MSKFFLIRMPDKISSDYDAMEWDWVTNEACRKHRPSQGKRLTPLQVVIDKPCGDDFMRTQYSDLVVTERGKRALEDAQLTGFSFKRAEAKGQAVRDTCYWELRVHGFGGFVNISCIDSIDTCNLCSWRHFKDHGTLDECFDERKWDGSDIFVLWPYPLSQIVTERFVVELASRGISGLDVKPLSSKSLSGATPYDPEVALTPEQQVALLSDVDYIAAISTRSILV